MKNNQILAVLTGVFFVCAAVTFFNVWNYRSALRRIGQLQNRVANQRVVGMTLEALLKDTSEYSRRNPAVIPVLQALTNNLNSTVAAQAAKPATK